MLHLVGKQKLRAEMDLSLEELREQGQGRDIQYSRVLRLVEKQELQGRQIQAPGQARPARAGRAWACWVERGWAARMLGGGCLQRMQGWGRGTG